MFSRGLSPISVSLALLALMVSLPFVQPIHLQPVASFYSEILAAALGLTAAGVLLLRRSAWVNFPLPRVALLPAVLLGGIAVQALAGRILFYEEALLHALYLLWATLMACMGSILAREVGVRTTAAVLAWAILLGAMLNALVAVAQFAGTGLPYWLVFNDAHPSTNLGQRNHAADYLWLGVVSAIYLRLYDSLSPRLLAVVFCVLITGVVLTGSRGPLANSVVLVVLGYLWLRQPPHPSQNSANEARHALILVGAAAIAMLLGSWLLSGLSTLEGFSLFFSASSVHENVAYRMAPAALSRDARWALWSDAWRIFLGAPWLGNGVGNYHFLSFEMASRTPAGALALPAEHSHNLILQWLADFGLPLTLAAVGVLGWWLRDILCRAIDRDRWWLLATLAVLLTHSLLEYPLWYSFFLAPAALLLGASDPRGIQITVPRGIFVFALILLLGGVTLINLVGDHQRLEPSAYRYSLYESSPATRWSATTSDMMEVARGSLLAPVAYLGIAVTMQPQLALAANQLVVCHRALAFQPRPDLAYKCAMLEEMNGNRDRAERLRQQARIAYPGSENEIDGSLEVVDP